MSLRYGLTFGTIHSMNYTLNDQFDVCEGGLNEKKTNTLLEKIQSLIRSEKLKCAFRMRAQDFTRNCILTFPILVLFILNLVRKSIQVELNNFIPMLSVPWVSKQAFSMARKKINPEVFTEFNDVLVEEFYTDNEFKTLFGYRTIAVDGSTAQLPNNNELISEYGMATNHTDKGLPMARISYAYDPLNDVTLDAIISPYDSSERDMAVEHVVNLGSRVPQVDDLKDLYILDRGYPSAALLFYYAHQGKDFIMRCSKSFIIQVNEAAEKREDSIITISIDTLTKQQKETLKKYLPEYDLSVNTMIQIRVITVTLNTGEKEILITSLIDKELFQHNKFIDFYHLRWGIEENYKFHKVALEIENFSGKSKQAVEQDFHATVFVANVRALLANEVQEELNKETSGKELQYEYKINKKISLGILKEKLIKALFMSGDSVNRFCTEVRKQIKKSLVPIRPGRSEKRDKNTSRRKWHMSQRRCL